jgi:recombinase
MTAKVTETTAPSRHRGRPPSCPPDITLLIVRMRLDGLSYEKISAALNAAGVPTPAGGKCWLRSSVDRVLHTKYASEFAARLREGN